MDDRNGKARGGGVVDYEALLQRQQPQDYYHQYGTFQGVAYYSQAPPPPPPPPQPPTHAVVGIPQPAPPPGAAAPFLYPHGYQSVHGYAVAEGTPVRLLRLPCCGLGIGWFLFITGFFLAFIPWYVGALLLLCARMDYREKPGLVACMIAAILAAIAITFGVSQEDHPW